MTTAVERFLKYVSYDTQSDEAYDTCPSTEKQLLLANELKRELEEMGASDVRMSEYGYLFARIPDNTGSTLHRKKRKLLSALRLLTVHPALDKKTPSRHLASFPTWTPRRP